jgi:hypothetical protein
MNTATTMDCICGTTHTFPAGIAFGTCAGCGLGLVLAADAPLDAGDITTAEDAVISDDAAVQSPDLLVAKIALLLARGDDGRVAAIALASRALDEARAEGRDYVADRDGDPAEDYEPADIDDDSRTNPYTGGYEDDGYDNGTFDD